jgi:thiol-disulfide isomerase/thioredoxin
MTLKDMTMFAGSVFVGGAISPLNMSTDMLRPAERFDWPGLIARQVREIGARHRFRAAATAAGICRGGKDHRGNQRDCENLQDLQQRVAPGVAGLIAGREGPPTADTSIRPICGGSRDGINGPMRRRQAFVMAIVTAKRIAHATTCLAVGATIAWLALASEPVRATPEMNKAAPTLVVGALDGTTFDLAKQRGKVVLVNYWATWCAPCRKELPKLDAFYRRYHSQGLEMIGISVDEARDLAKVRKVMAALAYPGATLKSITDNGFGPPEGVPITWIIDADGKVRDRMIDVRDDLLNGLVVPLLPH